MEPSVNTPEENAEVFQSHFQTLFDREAINDEFVLDHRPTDEKTRAATRKLKNNALGESGIMLQVLKCLLYYQETFQLLKTVILKFWDSETVPKEWNIGYLIILPRKGDLS